MKRHTELITLQKHQTTDVEPIVSLQRHKEIKDQMSVSRDVSMSSSLRNWGWTVRCTQSNMSLKPHDDS